MFDSETDDRFSAYFQAEMREMSTAERVESIFRHMDEVRKFLSFSKKGSFGTKLVTNRRIFHNA